MQPMLPCPSPTCCWWTWTSAPLLCKYLWLGAYSVCFFFFSLIIFSSEITKLPTDTPVKGFPIVWKLLLFHDSLPRNGSKSLHLLSLFSSFIFCATFFWVPGVLCQRSEVVLWKSLNIQMIFWWICGGESGLPILFLLHLGSVPSFTCLFNITVNILGVITNFCLKVSYILCLHKKNLVSWTTYLSSS